MPKPSDAHPDCIFAHMPLEGVGAREEHYSGTGLRLFIRGCARLQLLKVMQISQLMSVDLQ